MGCSPTTPWAAVCLLLLLVLLPNVQAQQSPCGDSTLSMKMLESFNGSSIYLVPDSLKQVFTKQIVVSENPNLEITIAVDPDNPPPSGLEPDSTTLEVQYNALSSPKGYDLLLKKSVDRDGTDPGPDDDMNTLQYRLRCVDPANSTTTFYHVLKIQLIDLNDNAPEFQGTPYQITVDELTPVGMIVFNSISTTDLDNGNNKLVQYSITTASDSQFRDNEVFTLSREDNTSVVLSKPLDYEAMVRQTGNASLTVYRMNITATDLAEDFSPVSSTALLEITIKDGDDLGPVFIYDSCPNSTSPSKPCVRPKYSASIRSGATTFLEVLPVPRLPDPTQTVPIRVRDGDTLNAPVQCSITYSDPTGYEDRFAVTTRRVSSSSTEYECDVRVNSPIDTSSAFTLDIVLLATEQTPNSYSEAAVISLDVIPRNMSSPATPTATCGPCEESGADVRALIGAVVGVGAAVAAIIIIAMICLWYRNGRGVSGTELVTDQTWQGASVIPRGTPATGTGTRLQSPANPLSAHGATQQPSAQTNDDYEPTPVSTDQGQPDARGSSYMDMNGTQAGHEQILLIPMGTPATGTGTRLQSAANPLSAHGATPNDRESSTDSYVDMSWANYEILRIYQNTKDHLYMELKKQ